MAVVVGYQKLAEAESDAAGQATLCVPVDAPLHYVLAVKPKTGLDYYVYRGKEEPTSDPYKLPPDHAEPLGFVLNGTRAVTVRVVDAQDQPLAGVRVFPWYFEKPKKGGYLNVSSLSEFKKATDNRGIAAFHVVPTDNTGAD